MTSEIQKPNRQPYADEQWTQATIDSTRAFDLQKI